MRSLTFLLLTLTSSLAGVHGLPAASNSQHVFEPEPNNEVVKTDDPPRKLHGRFLHITDLHPDPFYKPHTSTAENLACHRSLGPSGLYGAETSDCDSPFTLVNSTFTWLEHNLKDKIDFIIWTGDSARHDNDERVPRSAEHVISLNKYVAGKFFEVFGKGDNGDSDPSNDLHVPIIPTFGNNDILPHNILLPGPNKWLQSYTQIWGRFIPEAQRHSFQHGGWFWTEVIPGKLAVFSLNTLYFFDRNSGVDGCALRSEPGWDQMEWLRVQLLFMRQRGVKAILTGHVPPARTGSKQNWDETCWQRYTLWLTQFRDVVITGVWGHMNIDHFLLQDAKEIDIGMLGGGDFEAVGGGGLGLQRGHLDDEFTIESGADYLKELRERWADLPDTSVLGGHTGNSSAVRTEKKKGKKGGKRGKRKKNRDKALKEMGGPWAERFQLSLIGPSVVPNYFPTLRVVEYNISGLEDALPWSAAPSSTLSIPADVDYEHPTLGWEEFITASDLDIDFDSDFEAEKKKKKHRKGGKKKPDTPPTDPNLHIPPPPSSTAPPGPAYSPQSLTLLGYTQYFANLTRINNDTLESDSEVDESRWREGKHRGKKPVVDPGRPKPGVFGYEVEYRVGGVSGVIADEKKEEDPFELEDMTVGSYVKLAKRIGDYDKKDAKSVEAEKKKGKKGGKGKGKNDEEREKDSEKAWKAFVRRAFVGTLSEEDIGELVEGL